ncbi:MAG: hypothetical protein MI923_02330 [Phycisphaerales bacterium]|nr:hypothetical protein [Phycisphaerales bacterium]
MEFPRRDKSKLPDAANTSDRVAERVLRKRTNPCPSAGLYDFSLPQVLCELLDTSLSPFSSTS